jgi:molybdate/tungstate transport system ATP-binding protein
VIEASGLTARAGAFTLCDVTFTVPRGGYGAVIGPAGSGKTTLLETIAGLIPLTAGALKLGGQDVRGVPPERRGVGFVYQRGYLFPHLSVEGNVLYGAPDAGYAREVARRLGVHELLARRVRGLSGGERALVALARAVAARPALLLLDEPLSALDPRRRALVRREVRALHRELGATVLHVTHDFTEAGLLADVAVLLDEGRVLQWGAPSALFREPASPRAAEFLGAENVFAGEVRVGAGTPTDAASRAVEFRTGVLTFHTVSDAAAGAGHAVIRAEEVLLATTSHPSSARNQFEGVVTEVASLGALTHVVVDIGGTPLVAALTTRSAIDLSLREGQRVWASFKAMAVHLC